MTGDQTVYLITQYFFLAFGGTYSTKVMHSITKEAVELSQQNQRVNIGEQTNFKVCKTQ